jgi:hypothetical protein
MALRNSASLYAIVAAAPADTPVSPNDGNGQDAAPLPDLDTILERSRAGKTRTRTKGNQAAAEPTVKVAYKPPLSDPLGDKASDGEEGLEEGPDPFDPKNLRIDPISIEGIGERVLTEGQVAVRKPHRRKYFRVHPDLAFRETMAVIILKEEMNETYLIEPRLAQGLVREITFVELLTCINVGGNVFLWPLPTPGNERRRNRWHTSAREAAKIALTKWVRIIPNMEAGCYDTYTGADDLAVVEYPKGKTFRDFLKLAFGDGGIIRDKDHPLLKRLRGQKV